MYVRTFNKSLVWRAGHMADHLRDHSEDRTVHLRWIVSHKESLVAYIRRKFNDGKCWLSMVHVTQV